MGKIDSQSQARMDGMAYALRIAKKEGVEGLDKELKRRGITGLGLPASHKEIDHGLERTNKGGITRKYAREPKSIANLTFEMIEQIVSPIKPGKNIKIWEKRTPTKYDVKKYRLVTGKVKAVYSKMIHVQVKERGEVCYNECFLKSDLARYKFEIQ